jgi:hypothetical protein
MSIRMRSVLWIAGVFATGCGDARVEAGLANAPSAQRQTRPRVTTGDVIANGQESCPEGAAVDPLPGRIPPCEEARSDAGALAPRKSW